MLSFAVYPTDCPTPTNPPNGFVTFTQTTPGSQANYDCDSGYGIDGNPNLKCLASGHWDEPPPACPGELEQKFQLTLKHFILKM